MIRGKQDPGRNRHVNEDPRPSAWDPRIKREQVAKFARSATLGKFPENSHLNACNIYLPSSAKYARRRVYLLDAPRPLSTLVY